VRLSGEPFVVPGQHLQVLHLKEQRVQVLEESSLKEAYLSYDADRPDDPVAYQGEH